MQFRVFLQGFNEFDEVGVVNIFIYLRFLPLQMNLLLRQVAFTQLHKRIPRFFFTVERIAPQVVVNHLHHTPYQIIYVEPNYKRPHKN